MPRDHLNYSPNDAYQEFMNYLDEQGVWLWRNGGWVLEVSEVWMHPKTMDAIGGMAFLISEGWDVRMENNGVRTAILTWRGNAKKEEGGSRNGT